MAGTVLENLSRRKLLAVAGILLSLQIISFMLGGLVAPAPATPWLMIGTKCVRNRTASSSQFYWPRPINNDHTSNNCDAIDFENDKERMDREGIKANDIVFSFQLPGPRDNRELEMDKWFQHMTGMLHFEVEFNDNTHPLQDTPPKLLLDIKLGYRESVDDDKEWHLLGSSSEERMFKCHIAQPHLLYSDDDDDEEDDDDDEIKTKHYECPVVPLFELPAYFPFYLLNLRLPLHPNSNFNMDIGSIHDISLVTIFQNGGFTRVWLGLKTFLFLLVIPVIIWFWRRIRALNRRATLLERSLLGVGASLTVLDLPIEWISMSSHTPSMPLISDLRQGLFMTSLFCFWLIFIGEHIMDGLHRDSVRMYWKQLIAVSSTCIFLLIFDTCERGVQLVNPFYSIWSTEATSRVALAFIILAGISGAIYMACLLYQVVQVFRHINIKRRNLPSMSARARKFYQSIIFRFKFMMIITILCIIITVSFYFITDIAETSWKFREEYDEMREPPIQINSAFFTGIYGMWNLYVILLLTMYAPSYKQTSAAYTDDSDGGEEVEFTQLTTSTTTAQPAPLITPTAAAAARATQDTEETTALTSSPSGSSHDQVTAFISKAAQD